MAARRRVADTLLLTWIVTLSRLLILVGLVAFLVFLSTPGADRWTEAGRLVGATLFQVGAVTLILELVHLERLLGVKVTYRHRGYVDRRGYFPWRATAWTHNLRVKTIGFEGFDTYPIPSPSLPSEDDRLEVFDNGIYYRGVLYPNSTFTFFWTERAR
jgi:hypothetical protein